MARARASAGRDNLLIVAGEASGDLHGAHLLAELKRLGVDVETWGVGGDRLIAEGLQPVAHSGDVGVVGLAEVLRELPKIRGVFNDLLKEAQARRPTGAVLIDFPDFNLRLAKQLKALGIPVVYYVSPQVWAWRRGRVRTIAERVDRMLTLFDFEVDFYREHGVSAVHVGHPIVEEVPETLRADPAAPRDDVPARIALLPGSRRSEVTRLLPVLLQATASLAQTRKVEAVLIEAPTVPRALIEECLASYPTGQARVVRRTEDRLAAVSECDLALCASGTATLEIGLLEVPMIVVYRLASLTYAIAKRLVKVDHVALVNLVLGGRVAPELLQGEAEPASIAATADALLSDVGRRRAMQTRLAELRTALGTPGASQRAAREVIDAFPWREEDDA
ncbi:MAG: lipid-A-disaccharide synthase [Acidobacteriota bacterium]